MCVGGGWGRGGRREVRQSYKSILKQGRWIAGDWTVIHGAVAGGAGWGQAMRDSCLPDTDRGGRLDCHTIHSIKNCPLWMMIETGNSHILLTKVGTG